MFDLENLNPPVRFYWPDSDEEWVEFRLVPTDVIDELRKKAGIKPKVEYRRIPRLGAQRFEYQDTSEEKMKAFLDEMIVYQIFNWHLLSPDGKEIECSRENKLKLARGSKQFESWMDEKIEQMEKEVQVRKEEEEANL